MTSPHQHDEMPRREHRDSHRMMSMGWGRFAAMIATSTVIMFFLMYQLVYEPAHLEFSLNRLFASLVMAAVMTVVMLGFMWSMYKPRETKIAVVIGAVVLGTVFLGVNRGQGLVSDESFMLAMIPHHSIAINNARKADIRDPRVRRLADEIIAAQVREIREMQLLLEDIGRNGRRGEQALPAAPAVLTPDMDAEAREAVR